ncbi:MAG: MFS transporter [archaeon]
MSLALLTFALAVSTMFASLIAPFFPVFISGIAGGSLIAVGIALAITKFSTVVLAIPLNLLGDSLGRKPLMVVGSIVGAWAFYQYLFVSSVEQLYFLALVVGLANALTSVAEAVLASLTSGERRGTKVGKFGMLVGIAGAGGTVAGGYLVDTLGFDTLFIIIAGAYLLTGALFLLVDTGQKETQAPTKGG